MEGNRQPFNLWNFEDYPMDFIGLPESVADIPSESLKPFQDAMPNASSSPPRIVPDQFPDLTRMPQINPLSPQPQEPAIQAPQTQPQESLSLSEMSQAIQDTQVLLQYPNGVPQHGQRLPSLLFSPDQMDIQLPALLPIHHTEPTQLTSPVSQLVNPGSQLTGTPQLPNPVPQIPSPVSQLTGTSQLTSPTPQFTGNYLSHPSPQQVNFYTPNQSPQQTVVYPSSSSPPQQMSGYTTLPLSPQQQVITPATPSTSKQTGSRKSKKTTKERKPKLYEMKEKFANQIDEKRRQDAINSKRNRDQKKANLAMLRQKVDEFTAQRNALEKEVKELRQRENELKKQLSKY